MMFPLLIIVIVLSFSLPLVHSQCNKSPVIFNFGDSNSDTGGFAVGLEYNFGPPYGRKYFHQSSGRLCDGRLIIDFLCKFYIAHLHLFKIFIFNYEVQEIYVFFM